MAKKTAKKEKSFKVRRCPKCKSDNVGVVLSGIKGEWECHKCDYKGMDVNEEEFNEEEFMKYLDSKGEDVS